MVRYNTLPLVDRETQASDDAVFQEDLPTKGGLSGIDLILRNTNGATSNLLAFLTEVVEKIEVVVNGDEKRVSLTGEEAFRYAWMRDGQPPGHVFDEQASAVQELHLPIQFGRYLGDPLFGMKLSNYNNAQLQIDYDAEAVNAVGATGFLTANMEISALLHITDANKEPAYRGMIGTREIRNFTSVASGDEYVALPQQHPIVGIGVYAKEDNVAGHTDITHARLSLDNDAKQPIRGRWEHHVARNRAFYTENEIVYNLLKGDTDYVNTHLDNIREATIENQVAETIGAAATGKIWFAREDGITGNRVTFAVTSILGGGSAGFAAAAEGTDQNIRAAFAGDIGHYIYWPMGDRMTLEDALKPAEWGDADVLLTQGGAGAYVGVIVEELRTS